MNIRSILYNNAGVYYMTRKDDIKSSRILFAGARVRLSSNPLMPLEPITVHSELLLAQLSLDHPQTSLEGTIVLRHSCFYLIETPIEICEKETPPVELQQAIILFNSGLLEQLCDPASVDGPQLYHAASSALTAVEDSRLTLLLAIGLLNNTGVWCQSTGDDEGARSCMEQLNLLLVEEEQEKVLLPEMYDGVTSNVRSILGARLVVSRAA